MPAVAVGGVAAEGGHLDHARRLGPDHRNHPERGADRQRPPPAEQRADLLGRGAGGHVVVFRRSPEQLIAYAPARPIRREPRPAQTANHLGGESALFLRHQHTESRSRRKNQKRTITAIIPSPRGDRNSLGASEPFSRRVHAALNCRWFCAAWTRRLNGLSILTNNNYCARTVNDVRAGVSARPIRPRAAARRRPS